jgi:hypothetical protein
MFMSIMSGPNRSAFFAARANDPGSLPKSWTAIGRCAGVTAKSSSVRLSDMQSPFELAISPTT